MHGSSNELPAPPRLWSRAEVLGRPSPIPLAPGVHAWFFTQPRRECRCRCHVEHGATLLYVGISPKPPPADGGPPSKQTVHSRVRYHYHGNAEGSTLRLTLGVLLAHELGTGLRRVGGSGSRLTFSDGEAVLNEWMDEHARGLLAGRPVAMAVGVAVDRGPDFEPTAVGSAPRGVISPLQSDPRVCHRPVHGR